MNHIGFNDVKDEFGCSECDYKCSWETDKIEHSAIHQSSNKTIELDDIAIENDNFVSMQAKLKCEKNIEPSTRLSDTPIINHIQTHIPVVKRESCSDEEMCTDENYPEREIGENKLKLEHIHIKDLLIFTEDGIMNNENINYMSDMLSSQSELSQTYLDFPKYSHGLSLKKNKSLTTSIEVEVDNTGVYIPPGWKRKLYKTPSPCKRFVIYDCIYLTELGTKVRLKRDACAYLVINPRADVNVEKLNFKLPTYKYRDSGHQKQIFEDNSYRKLHTPNIPMNVNMHAANLHENVDLHASNEPIKLKQYPFGYMTEIDVDNTGKYIPEGWQRKVYRRFKGARTSIGHRPRYQVKYISPLGRSVSCKSDLSEYIKYLQGQGITESVEVDKMDFLIKSHNLSTWTSRRRPYKEEVEVDNTDIYVPEGWQRKLFKYPRKNSGEFLFICYVSPFNKEIRCVKEMKTYLRYLNRKGNTLLLDVERTDFSIPCHMTKNKDN
ncbi:unnamed protein product [Meganyctiphanes norvegica]|uniref:MBD domain-containing protein n=2 Tax=Meganyctiphanes norvegica TaxID=48144 RepID=A0AAV2SE84_MEGNR